MKQVHNIDQFRAKIDKGETHDKVAVSDPAAAPLGTDEEAAGTPVSPTALQQAHCQETGRQVTVSTRPWLWWILPAALSAGVVLMVGMALVVSHSATP